MRFSPGQKVRVIRLLTPRQPSYLGRVGQVVWFNEKGYGIMFQPNEVATFQEGELERVD